MPPPLTIALHPQGATSIDYHHSLPAVTEPKHGSLGNGDSDATPPAEGVGKPIWCCG